MNMTIVDLWMQRVYWGSQILLPLIAIVAGWLALKQAWTFRLFELLRLMEEPRVRLARRVVVREISQVPTGQSWWEDNRLHDAAAMFCSVYDELGGIIKFHGKRGPVERFFVKRWGETLVRAYPIVRPFLDFRRRTAPESYSNIEWLFDLAKGRYPNVKPIETPTS